MILDIEHLIMIFQWLFWPSGSSVYQVCSQRGIKALLAQPWTCPVSIHFTYSRLLLSSASLVLQILGLYLFCECIF
jgi:hypothetical protein